MPESPSRLTTFSPDGHDVRWSTWDGDHSETLSLSWDNEAWTAVGRVGREQVEYVLRVAPTWHVRQFLLFRYLDEPDLWLAIDAAHHWGEVNGSYRAELDGCADIELGLHTIHADDSDPPAQPRRGGVRRVDVIDVDVETLAAVRQSVRYERLDDRTYRHGATLVSGAVRGHGRRVRRGPRRGAAFPPHGHVTSPRSVPGDVRARIEPLDEADESAPNSGRRIVIEIAAWR